MNASEMIRRLQEENQVLREKNADLVQENAALRQMISEMGEQFTGLQGKLAGADERIAELERESKGPPGFVKANKPKQEGEKAPRRARAKEANHGRKRAEVVTRREEHHITRCPACDSALCKERVAWSREVVELPPPPAIEVTQHIIYKGYCRRCEVWKHAEPHAPGEVLGQRRFGTRLTMLIGYLSESLRMPNRVIQEYLKTFHAAQISVGAINDLRCGLAQRLEPVMEELKARIRSSPIVHADETGWREDGQNGYVWGFSTPGEDGVRYYVYDASRGGQIVERVLGEAFQGVLSSDFYGAYNVYVGPHQRCWVHLLRDMRDLKEEHPEDDSVQTWVQQLRALHDRAQAFVKSGSPEQSEREALYVALVSEVEKLGLRYAREKHPCRALAKRVLRHQDELFQFVLVAGLAADNNLAERSLRPLVVIRKISGGTRGPQGSQTRMTLASVFATWQARGLNPYEQGLALLQPNSCT
jgi:hypothetical protein